jgi:hypothetical protein
MADPKTFRRPPSKLVMEVIAPTAAYSTNGIYLTSTRLNLIEEASAIPNPEGYLADVTVATGNSMLVKFYYTQGISGKPFVEVADGSGDLSGKNFTFLLEGR